MASRIQPQSIDFTKLFAATAQERSAFQQTSIGQQIISRLSPSQIAALFPDYYKKYAKTAASGLGLSSANVPMSTSGYVPQYSSGGNTTAVPSSGNDTSTTSKVHQKFTDALANRAAQNVDLSKYAGSPLSKQRQGLASNVSESTKKHILALSYAEEGGSLTDRKRLIETIFNRAAAHGKSLESTSETDYATKSNSKKYYEPLGGGAGTGFGRYQSELNKLNDPDYYKKRVKEFDEVVAGSNYSNYATQNGSAGVGRHAQQTQSVGIIGDNGETFSRKDKTEYANIHGAGYTAQEKKFFDSISKAQNDFIEQQNAKNDPSAPMKGDGSGVDQTGVIAPEGINIKKPQTAIPDGTPKPVIDYLNTLPEDQRTNAINNMKGMTGDEVGKVFADSVEAQATVPGPTGKILSGDEAGLEIPQAGPIGPVNRYSSHYSGGVPNVKLSKVHTQYGNITVNQDSAIAFKGFFDDLHSAGAPLRQPGSYNPRPKRWNANSWSEHAFGNAVDMDDTIQFSKAFQDWRKAHPGEYERIKTKWGIIQPLPTKDPAHHEFGGTISQEARDQLEKEIEAAKTTPGPQPAITKATDEDLKEAAEQQKKILASDANPFLKKRGDGSGINQTGQIAPSNQTGQIAPSTTVPNVSKPITDIVPTEASPTGTITANPIEANTGATKSIKGDDTGENTSVEVGPPTPVQETPSVPKADSAEISVEDIKPDAVVQASPEPTAEPASQAPTKAQDAKQADPAPTDDAPKMKSGGRVQVSGEDISLYDNENNRKLGEVNRGENIRVEQEGSVQVTPEHRVDPRKIETAPIEADEAREEIKERNDNDRKLNSTPAQQSLAASDPTKLIQHTQWGAAPTPNSYIRAMEQVKGKRNSGAFNGSRFGEEQLSTI